MEANGDSENSWASPANQTNARAVGEAFVPQYYKLASTLPKDLHKFYRKDALCSFGDSKDIVSGSSKIRDKIVTMGFAGAKFDLVGGTFDFHPTPEEGICIMVTGSVHFPRQEEPKNFVQTFLLRREQKEDKPPVYFIQNDVHRFLPAFKDQDTVSVPAAAPVAAAAPSAKPEAAVHKPVPQPAEHEKAPVQQQQQQHDAEPQPPKASTWASIAAKEAGEPTPRALPPARRPREEEPAPASSSPSEAPNAGGPAQPIPGCSLCIKNADPEIISKQELSEAFAGFGAFTALGVETHATKKYAFINYDSPEAAKAAMAKQPIVLKGITLEIELRHTSGSGRNRTGRGPPAAQPTSRGSAGRGGRGGAPSARGRGGSRRGAMGERKAAGNVTTTQTNAVTATE